VRKLTPKKIVVLLSGGLDSSTLAYLASKSSKPYSKNRVFTLTFDYGQRHKKELISASKVSKLVGAVSHKVVKFDLTSWGGSSLTDKNKEVPINRKMIAGSIPNTYVPARNTIFLSFALAFSEVIGADEIYIGVNSIDYSGYVDCRPNFIREFQKLARVATVSGVGGKVLKIKTPLIDMTKAQIVKLGEKLGVNWSITWSCYLGGKLACGLCDSCQLRLKGFALAGVKDLLCYKQYPRFYKEFLKSQK
jgi:7-cyano-7-deazaguanine synthase